MDKLRRYDLYAPVSESDKSYAFEQAADLVLDTLNGFSPQLAAYARQVFEDGHLDSEIRKGKEQRRVLLRGCCPAWRPGCCSTIPARRATWRRWPTNWATRSTP